MQQITFRVLVIDDRKTTLERLELNLTRVYTIDDTQWRIDLVTLFVDVVETSADKYQITEETITNLSKLCNKRFDLILADYGYRNPKFSIDKHFYELGSGIDISQFKDKIFFAPDLKKRAIEIGDKSILSNLEKRFFNYTGKVVVYTYGDPRYAHLEHPINVKHNFVKDLFLKAKDVETIDTRLELFNGEEFGEDKYDREYYSYLISKFLNRVVEKELLEFILSRRKSLAIKPTSKIIGTVTAIGLSVGVISQFLGTKMTDFILKKDYSVALVFFVLAISLVTIVSLLLGKFFRRILLFLFPDNGQD